MPAFTLPPRCDRAAADALHRELLTARDSGPIELDGSQVEQIGQAMLQLVLSARRTGEGARIEPSAAFAEAARMTGLSAQLFDEARP